MKKFVATVGSSINKAKEATTKKFSSDKTQDEEYKQIAKQLEKQQERITKLCSYVTKYNASCTKSLERQIKLADALSRLLAEETENHRAQQLATNYNEVSQSMYQQKALTMDEQLKYQFSEPVGQYLAQYQEINERIRERKKRCHEMDKLTTESNKLRAKSESGNPMTESRLSSVRESYEDINAELKVDLPKLYYDRGYFFEPVVANLIDIQIRYHQEMARMLIELQNTTTDIDRNKSIQYPSVITPRENSSISKTYVQATTQVEPRARGESLPPVPRRPSVSQRGAQVIALWDFIGQDSSELTFKQGDTILVLSKNGDWWTGVANGKEGLFPANYVKDQ